MRRWVHALAPVLVATIFSSCSEETPRRATPVQAPPTEMDLVREQVAKDPRNADAWFHLSEFYERASAYEQQAEALRKVIALRPQMGFAYFKLGTACNRLQKYEEAVSYFEQAGKHVKNQPMLYNNLAFSYGKLGKTREEIAALKKAIALRPRYAVARFNLGMALLKKGDREGAKKEVRSLEEFDEGAAASLRKQIEAAGE